MSSYTATYQLVRYSIHFGRLQKDLATGWAIMKDFKTISFLDGFHKKQGGSRRLHSKGYRLYMTLSRPVPYLHFSKDSFETTFE